MSGHERLLLYEGGEMTNKKIIAYEITALFEDEFDGAMTQAIVSCSLCGVIISPTGGRRTLYCPDCINWEARIEKLKADIFAGQVALKEILKRSQEFQIHSSHMERCRLADEIMKIAEDAIKEK